MFDLQMVATGVKRVCLLLCTLSLTNAFYVPGVAPEDYKKGDNVEIKVGNLMNFDRFYVLE